MDRWNRTVQRYPVRNTHRGNLEPDAVARIAQTHFEGVERAGDRVKAHFGALAELTVWAEGRDLAVETRMDPAVEEAIARETIRRYNDFLQDATGYTAKERAKRLRKSATSGDGA